MIEEAGSYHREIVAGSPANFGAWSRAEIPRWGKVIKETGATGA